MSDARQTPTRKRPKLCVLLPAHWRAGKGGSEYQAKLLVEFLRRNYDVEVIYLTLNLGRTLDYSEGYRVVEFSSKRGIRRYGTFLDVWRLYRALAREAPDMIYQQVGCAHTGIAAHYARRRGCRMIWRLASDNDLVGVKLDWRQPHRFVERLFLEYGIRNAEVIITQTRQQQQALAQKYGRTDAIVVRNFHPTPSETASDAATSGQIKRVVWIGNLKPLKNPEAFIRLAGRFTDRPDIEFLMVGGRQGKTEWLSANDAMIAAVPALRYLGERSQEEVNALLETSYLLVNTSDYEGFPNTFIQAWMRAVPVVSLTVNPDGLLDGHGIGAVCGSEEALFATLRRFLDDPALVRAMGERSRAFALEEFSEANIDRIAALLGLEALAR
jgi:glycosyltransferase involved in cell wall biosynthesis